MICSFVNLARFIVRPPVRSDSSRRWRKNPVAGHYPITIADQHIDGFFPIGTITAITAPYFLKIPDRENFE